MFPYSLGVQAPTKDEAIAALVKQTDELAEKHPDDAKKYDAHIKAVHDAADALVELLPEDDADAPSDVAISASGHLVTSGDDVGSADVHIHAGRRPTDVSKHPKKAPKQSKAKKDAAPATGEVAP